MAQVRTQHLNAKLTPAMRRRMVDVLIVEGWGVAATAERIQVDSKTVRKWRDRYFAEGPDGLVDRSSRPRRSPGRTPTEVRAEVIRTRQIFDTIRRLNEQIGLTVLMIEQNARQGLEASDRGHVIEMGRITRQGFAADLLSDPKVRRAFLGAG